MDLSPTIRSLESSFLSNLTGHARSTPYFTPRARQEIVPLLSQDVPVRQIADSVFHALLEHWVEEKKGQLGGANVTLSWHPWPRLFQPFGQARPELEARRGDFAKEVSRSPASAGRVLEFRMVSPFGEDGPTWVEDALQLAHSQLLELGFFLCDRQGDVLVARIPSLTAMEIGMEMVFPGRGVKLCATDGIIDSKIVSQMNRHRYRPCGLPLKKVALHEVDEAHPAEFAIHEIFHVFYLCTLPVEVRIAASWLFDATKELEVAERTLLLHEREILNDLILDSEEGFSRVRQGILDKLPPERGRFLLERYEALKRSC